MKRYGPYDNGVGYLFWVDHYGPGNKKSVLVHRELMEMHLGRKLGEDEEVHHKNKKTKDNRIENLEVLCVASYRRLHITLPEVFEFLCPECGKLSIKPTRRIRHNQQTQGKEAPFCGRSCAGSFSQRQQKITGWEIIHGSRYTYKYYVCRCALCKKANAEYQKTRRARVLEQKTTLP